MSKKEVTKTSEKSVEKKKNGYTLQTLDVKAIKIIPGFNPRKTLGDLSSLKSTIREHGIEQPIVVRPTSKEGVFEIIVGHRRLASSIELGLKTIPAVIRHDLTDLSKALSFAAAENNSDVRTALTSLEQATVFKRIQAANKSLSPKKIGAMCGCSDQHVRRMISLLNAPKEIKSRLEKGNIRSGVAVTLLEMNPNLQKKVMDSMTPGMTEAEVRKLGNQLAKEAKVPAKVNPDRSKRTSGSDLAVVRGRTEMRNLGNDLVCQIMDIEDEGGKTEKLRYALCVVYYYLGKVDKLDITSSDFKSSFTEDAKNTEVVDEGNAKKSSTGKKAKK